jgi:protoheme IX farnesyltransferase
MLKLYFDLTKMGIVIFVLLTGLAGYASGYQIEVPFSLTHLMQTIFGLYLLSAGSLALNQAQEYKLDQKMNRTKDRPVASGKIKPAAAAILALGFIFAGLNLLYKISETSGWLGLLTVVLYNGAYTLYWKPKWAYAAVPGAIPGALPITVGYAATNSDIFNSESIYLFMILFLWQMPHFWALALKFKEDYRSGGVPTLPVSLGVEKTLFQIGLYTFVYLGFALAAPWFVHASWMYILIVIPFVYKVFSEFIKFYKCKGEKWFAFFMWTNVSMLVFLLVPVIDKWNFLFFNSN